MEKRKEAFDEIFCQSEGAGTWQSSEMRDWFYVSSDTRHTTSYHTPTFNSYTTIPPTNTILKQHLIPYPYLHSTHKLPYLQQLLCYLIAQHSICQSTKSHCVAKSTLQCTGSVDAHSVWCHADRQGVGQMNWLILSSLQAGGKQTASPPPHLTSQSCKMSKKIIQMQASLPPPQLNSLAATGVLMLREQLFYNCNVLPLQCNQVLSSGCSIAL